MKIVQYMIELIGLKTKFATLIPFFVGTFYSLTHYQVFDLTKALLLISAIITIDVAITAHNHYRDYKRFSANKEYSHKLDNPLFLFIDKLTHVKLFIFFIYGITALLWGILIVITDGIVLAIGLVSLIFGMLYFLGPVPIKETPLGESVGGIFMGVIIAFISAYIHLIPLDIIEYSNHGDIFKMAIKWRELLNLIVIGIPMMFLISNILIANNLYNIKQDIKNKRMTLPILIGEEQATKYYLWAVYGAYASVVLAIIIGAFDPIHLVALASFPIVRVYSWRLVENPEKKENFMYSVKSLVVFSALYLLGFMLRGVQNYF